MSESSVSRQFVALTYDPAVRRERMLKPMWSYGQAMNTAATHAEQYPDVIVTMLTRVIITEDWQEPDFEAEEYRQQMRAQEREREDEHQ